jgi:N-acetyl-alpha-D-muramate 1-phosphate uridylyltransferase
VRVIGDRRYGIRIAYSHDGPRPIGTLAAIRAAASLLDERFLVLYGDTYLRLDYRAAALAWAESGLPALMTVLRNEGRWGISNADFDGTRVVAHDKRAPLPSMGWIDFGLGGLHRETLDLVGGDVTDLSDLYGLLAKRGELLGYEATERFYEIGTPDALAEAEEFLSGRSG